ncbi:MAG: hypothetical protein J5I91_03235 [Bacteroidetes bacterium]|nr:hypothetical protein [Bacteroidota bacterium]
MKNFCIKYLSDGPKNTGGYYHESFWFEQLQDYYAAKGFNITAIEERAKDYHKGFIKRFKWFWHLFKIAKADVVLVPGRCAMPVLLRNFFSKRKVMVVFHSLNSKGLRKNRVLSFYYSVIFKLVRIKSNYSLVVVAQYWKAFFYDKTRIPIERILLLPNLFDPTDYIHFQTKNKQKNIHLGMWSTKLDKSIYEIASHLSHKGYYCFFTTPDDIMSLGSYGYDIIYCKTQNEYKERVANALFTLTISAIPEGWPRVAHESFLLGTPVIAFNNAGLSELIYEANGYIPKNTIELLEIIDSLEDWELSGRFVQKFHINQAQKILATCGL